jgi:predicted nucleic acid-binding protein
MLHITPQVLIEFRNVATRPAAQNGLGLSCTDAAKLAAKFETTFPVVADTAAIYPAWKLLVEDLGIIGKQVHDARLIAVCQTHGLSHLLTFNVAHFARTSTSHPTVMVVDPRNV